MTHPASLVVLGDERLSVDNGGASRKSQLDRRVRELGASIRYVDPGVVVSGRTFARYSLRSGLAGQLMKPGRRLLISYGSTPSPVVLRYLASRCTLTYLDVPDEPRLQARDLGFALPAGYDVDLRGRLLDYCVARFDHVGFAAPGLCRLFVARPGQVAVPNAGDPAHFRPSPLPAEPVVALVGSSGAARGTDLLVRACERARRQWPNLRLLLALNDSGGLGNLAELRGRFGASRWISFERVNYEQLPAFLNRVTIGAVPHPRSEYLDLALPMKLFDYMSAARPVVSTDCPAAAKILEAHDAGVVCGAEPDALAGAISLVLGDRRRAHKLGLNGRRAIEVEHNWDHALAPLATTIQRALRQHD